MHNLFEKNSRIKGSERLAFRYKFISKTNLQGYPFYTDLFNLKSRLLFIVIVKIKYSPAGAGDFICKSFGVTVN